jgi:hypothetical protein
VVVALHLNQDSILIASWRNQIRIHFELIANRGFWGEETGPIWNSHLRNARTALKTC